MILSDCDSASSFHGEVSDRAILPYPHSIGALAPCKARETISQAVSSEGAFGAANFERIVSTLISTSENVGPAAYFEADRGIGLKTFISRPSAEPSASEKSFCMRTHANFKSFIELRISHTAF